MAKTLPSQSVKSLDPSGEWTPQHDLALIYLVLAHGTDDDLSPSEVDVMLRKLREWLPHLSAEQTRHVLRTAMYKYADRRDELRIDRAIASIKNAMPARQRMLALQDLVRLANADGVFLDEEEDLINSLLAAWEIGPYAGFDRED